MFGMLNDLQAPVEHEEEIELCRLEDEMAMNVGVDIDEDRTNNILTNHIPTYLCSLYILILCVRICLFNVCFLCPQALCHRHIHVIVLWRQTLCSSNLRTS
uniref:CACTA en-spm transposon protein n=1 Tax=Cucumis melo TaxID=3656 RepID=A0A9I9EFR7_CUCME